LCRAAAEAGGAAPAVLNAANEVAVAAFLDGKLPFTRIAVVVEQVLARYAPPPPVALADVMAIDAAARAEARGFLELVRQ
jgi:1-deoxy-D-xylulose-5-phosphate reductoisomerase